MVEQEGSCEVLVIGGGPSGSTIAALLAERGLDVLMLEKDKHPRWHIGESLLPMNMPMFDKLGVTEEIKRIGMLKRGAEFISPWHPAPVMIDFNDALDNTYPIAYQVRRDQFDEVMFKNAAAKGARVAEECQVTDVKFQPGA
jgi:2-polyprenyl-6-methoxyphenol hydroxylase-like FAD-dependent oxidoreductase